jgi:methyltransferase (TIGR00027 family)
MLPDWNRCHDRMERKGMKKNRSSKTALDVLAARAVNSLAPLGRRIIEDRYAALFLPFHWFPAKLYFRLAAQIPVLYWLPKFIAMQIGYGTDSLIALRHRFIDERFMEFYRSGIRQVVLLGAGYDSRALRFNFKDLRFIEIDHPATQKRKVKIMGERGRNRFVSLHFIPVDFTNDWLKTVVDEGVIRNEPTLFIWEGVSYYLPGEAVTYTLEGLKKIASSGSFLIFDFFPKEIADPLTENIHMKRVRRYGAARGENFLWGCDRDGIEEVLGRHGFRGVQTTSVQEFAHHLIHAHSMKIPVHSIFRYMVLAEAGF